MNTEQILMFVVALILGMLLANMLKSVCGCKVVEGQTDDNIKDCTSGDTTCSMGEMDNFCKSISIDDNRWCTEFTLLIDTQSLYNSEPLTENFKCADLSAC